MKQSKHTPFGRELKKLRIDAGETIRDMAKQLDITASYLSTIETGKRNIPVDMISKLQEKYNLSDKQKCSLLMTAYGLTCPTCGSNFLLRKE